MRKLIICSDGTWNSPDDEDRGKIRPSNITKISRAVLPENSKGDTQVVFYDEGVGTGFAQKFLGGITGYGLSKNILDCYQFLSHNYVDGDEIYLFGFSRGAYTSRSLAGLIRKIGMVEKDDVYYLPQLYDLYKQGITDGEIDAFYKERKIQRFKPRIKFIGVFDTVGALGVPFGGINEIISGLDLVEFQFHDVTLSEIVDFAYHAISIDERRVPFSPSLWSMTKDANTVMEQRWFSGVHSNIGGGYNPDGLANLALDYIVGKAEATGLEFDKKYLSFFKGTVKTPIRDSMSLKYKLLGENIREITLGDESNQVIDESVHKKIKADTNYNPKNVV